MLGRIVAVGMVIAVLLLTVLLQTTTPASIGPLGILLVFILLYVSALGMLTFLTFALSKIIAKIAGTFVTRRPIEPLSFNRAYYYSSVLALAPVLLVGMQSVGKVDIYDILLVFMFEMIACIYIAKRLDR